MNKFNFSGLDCLIDDRFMNWGKLFLRLFFGGMMLVHGLDKMIHFEELREIFPPTLGMSSEWSLGMIILVEAGCSLLVILGVLTRLSVLPLMFAMLIAAFFTFSPVTMAVAELPMLYFGGYFAILLIGPGRCSVDYWLAGRCRKCRGIE